MTAAIRMPAGAVWQCWACEAYNVTRATECTACNQPRQDAPRTRSSASDGSGQGATTARFGKCPHTGRAYRSKTEARWAQANPRHRYEALAIATPCGVYWPDFVSGEFEPNGKYARSLIEVKGSYIRDRALHKVKAAIRPARELGFAGIWLAQWDGKAWKVSEVTEG